MAEKTRRNPRQARSQATVEAILDAAFQILETRGLSRLTTNHIAERAGVSVGTLYQYFADKDAVLAAMGQRQAEALREQVTQILLASPERGSMRAIVQAVLRGTEGSPETRAVLSEALFRARGQSVLSEQHLLFLSAVRGQQALDYALGKESAFILTHTVICLARAAGAEPELGLDLAVLEDQLVLMLESYLLALASQPREVRRD